MKHGKKLLALALALCMAFALAVPAFAAEGNLTVGGTDDKPETVPAPPIPTGTNTSDASMANHVFDIYQIFAGEEKTETTGDGENQTTELLLTEIQWGSGFTVADSEITVTAENIKNFIEALKNETLFNVNNVSPFESIYNNFDANRLNISADAVARVIAGWTGDDANGYGDTRAQKFADIASAFLKTPYKTSIKYGDENTTLGQGYYLVKDRTVVSGEDATEGVKPDENNNVVNMYVLTMNQTAPFSPKVKADVPSLEKDVMEKNDSADEDVDPTWGKVADYDIGDTIWFTLTGTLPTDFDKYEKYTYEFTDTMGTGLEPVEASVKVYLTTRGEAAEDTDLLDNADNVFYVAKVEGQILTITMTDLKNSVWKDKNLTANSVFQVVYSAKLTEEIESFKVNNDAYLKFSNDPNNTGDGTSETPKKEVTVFTFTLNADKVRLDNEGNQVALSGAEFALYKKDPALAENKPADATEVPAPITLTTANGTATYYWYDNIEKVTGSENKFSIKGLDAGDYVLVESTVPNGYNKAENIFFKIVPVYNAENELTNLNTIITDSNGNEMLDSNGKPVVTITGTVNDGTLSTAIVNQRGVTLPGTGGIGTTIFYVVGGVLIAVAGVVLITKKRMQNAE